MKVHPEPFQRSLLDWTPPVASQHAAPGIKRAAKAGRVDPAVLTVAARIVGVETPHAEFWGQVNAITVCSPDTPRRRLDALKDMGLVVLGEPKRVGHVLILGVK